MRLTRPFLVSLLPGIALSALTLAALPVYAAPLKVACTGSSSMAGVGSSPGRHIPDELGKALGADFMVTNFGVAATTAIKSVSNAYASTPQMRNALASNPDVVFFWFGGNDSWVDTWNAHKGEFQADYTSMVRAFQALPSRPKTFLIRLWVFKEGPAQKVVLDREILPMIDKIAAETNSTVIDYRTFIEPHPEWFPDGMHASNTGTPFIGKFFADELTKVLNASADGGAPDTVVTVDAGGGDARADALPPTTDVAVAETSGPATPGSGGAPAAAGTGGAAGAGTGGAAGAGAGGAGGAGGASVPSGSGGSKPPAMTGSNGGGCSHAGTPSGGPAVFLLAALAKLARPRQPKRGQPKRR